jgi:hypothetical protein
MKRFGRRMDIIKSPKTVKMGKFVILSKKNPKRAT